MQTGTEALTERIDLAIGPITVLRPEGEIDTVIRVDTDADGLEFYWDLFLDVLFQLNPRVTPIMLDDPDYEVGDLYFWIITL